MNFETNPSLENYISSNSSDSVKQFAKQPAATDVIVPANQVIAILEEHTEIPILVPDRIPNIDQHLYITAQAALHGYSLTFDYLPGCEGATAGRYAEISAARGNHLSDPADTVPGETIEAIALDCGIAGQFIESLGVYSMAAVEWLFQGVSYAVAIKHGEKEEAIALANNTIASIRRKTPSYSTLEWNDRN